MTDFATGYFRCPECGNDVFVCYPQTVNIKAREQTWEFTCARCKRATALRVIDWRGDE